MNRTLLDKAGALLMESGETAITMTRQSCTLLICIAAPALKGRV